MVPSCDLDGNKSDDAKDAERNFVRGDLNLDGVDALVIHKGHDGARCVCGHAIDAFDALYREGATTPRILLRHVIPTALPAVSVQATLGMGGAILAEASLSFLGLGTQPPNASWGAMLGTAFPYMAQSPVPTIAAGVVISITVLCFNLIGDGIRDSVGRMRRAGD